MIWSRFEKAWSAAKVQPTGMDWFAVEAGSVGVQKWRFVIVVYCSRAGAAEVGMEWWVGRAKYKIVRNVFWRGKSVLCCAERAYGEVEMSTRD